MRYIVPGLSQNRIYYQTVILSSFYSPARSEVMTETLAENKIGYGSYKPSVGRCLLLETWSQNPANTVLADEIKSSARPFEK